MKRNDWQQTYKTQQQFHKMAADLRQRSTKSEQLLWEKLRNRQLDGYKFRRQVPVGMYILDFYCVEERLAIEVDGEIHAFQQEADQIRQESLGNLKIRFLRFTADEVENDLFGVLQKIQQAFMG